MSRVLMERENGTLVEAALRVLNTADPFEKARLGDSVASKWFQGTITHAYDPSQDLPVPDRPARLTDARGLDVLPTTISRFCNGGDDDTADLLETVIYPEEITHCAAGVKWFKYLCVRSQNPGLYQDGLASEESGAGGSEIPMEEDSEEVIQKFHAILRTHFRGPLKPPFNEKARKAACFGPQLYKPLAVKGPAS